jgi:glycosyltransferase involved in cell wall biosynthesis
VKIDLSLLRRYEEVTEYYAKSWRDIRPWGILKAVRSHHAVFCWFASWHSLLPVLFAHLWRKPSIVVTGGYDVANQPDIGYGSQRGGVRQWVARAVIRHASLLVANSKSACREVIQNGRAQPEKVRLVYHGIAPFTAAGSAKGREHVLTVGDVSRGNLWRKGLLPYVRAARLLPNYRFIIAGEFRDDAIEVLRAEAPPNVEFLGRVSDDQLASLFLTSKVYVQASRHEGFGMSLAEAMLGGCIPVVTKVGALPEVVGETGVYIEDQAPEEIAKGIKLALELGEDRRKLARTRVQEMFSLEQRDLGLLATVEGLMQEYRGGLLSVAVRNSG